MISIAVGAGCADRRLETGYQYRPLSSSSVERRAFYADPYSLEARRAESQSRQGSPQRSPLDQRR